MSLLSDAKTTIAKFLINMGRFDNIMNGSINTDVPIDNGVVPSIRKLFEYVKSINLFEDSPSIKSFGSPVNGDWTNVFNSAEASSAKRIRLPEGLYSTTLNYYQALNKTYVGPGKLVKSDGTSDAPFRSAIISQMPTLSTDRTKIFDGDMSKMIAAARTFIGSGANPTTLPDTYTNYPEWAQTLRIFDFAAGFNKDPADHAKGRSGTFMDVRRMYHGGQGDLVQRNLFLSVYSSREGATHFLANPAIVVDNGNIGAEGNASGAYLNHSEFIYSDNGLDVAVIDCVRNYFRTNNTGNLDTVWGHDRPQSSGSKPIDFFYAPFGPAKRGIDFTPSDFGTEQAAIVLKSGQKVYWNAGVTLDSLGANFYSKDIRNTYTHYDQGASSLINVVGGVGSQQISSSQILNTVKTIQKLEGPGSLPPNSAIPTGYAILYQPSDATKLAFRVKGPDGTVRDFVMSGTAV